MITSAVIQNIIHHKPMLALVFSLLTNIDPGDIQYPQQPSKGEPFINP